MNYQNDDARLRVPKVIAQRLAEVAKELNITGRAPWGTLARKVLLDFLEELDPWETHLEEVENE